MPTTRPRHIITESDDVAEALRDAADVWPDERDRPSRLLLHLIARGHRAIAAERQRETKHRRQAVDKTSGVLTGVYGPDYLRDLRDEWPA